MTPKTRDRKPVAAASTTLALVSLLSLGEAFAGEASPGVCKIAPPSLSRLGYPALPVELSRADAQKLKNARKAVAKKDWKAAKNFLEPLAATYSEDADVRFLLAILQAAQGASSEACGAIAHLLEMDLPATNRRFQTEPALAELRRSADGNRLVEHADAVRTLWRQATSDGLPAVMARGTRDVLDIWYPKYLRAGVYLHETKRFLPVTPPVDGAGAALFHPATKRAALVKLKVVPCREDNCPRVETVEVRDFRLDEVEKPAGRWRYEGENARPLELRSGAGGLEARVRDCCCYDDCVSPWEKVAGRRATPATTQSSATPNSVDEMTLTVDQRGSRLATRPDGLQIRKGSLVAGSKEIPLDVQHTGPGATHAIFVDPTTNARLVLSTIDGCQCGGKHEGAVLRHVLSRVDAEGRATVLMGGKGPAAAMLDGKRAFYLQTGDTVRRWPSMAAVGTRDGEPVMPGTLLVIPVTEERNCCGL